MRLVKTIKPLLRSVTAVPFGACLLLMALPAVSLAQEFENFVIEDIRIEGLRRFSPGIIFSRLPVTIGDELSPAVAIEIIEDLYDTGYFRSVEVLSEERILILQVEENPTIAEVSVSGATELSDSALENMLDGAGISKAKVFDRGIVEEAAKVIEEAYIERNFYHAEVTTVISPLPRNRVAILFEIEEGQEAAIRSIRLIGNEVFSTWRLGRDMRLEEKSVINFLTDNYRYSEQKLEADLARIRTRYLEAGYLRFEVESKQVEVSVDKRHIDIIIRLNEGKEYVVSAVNFEFASGVIGEPFDLEIFRPLVNQAAGDVYNGQETGDTIAQMKEQMGDLGYANSAVSFEPVLNDEDGNVDIVYTVNPESIVYVRRIDIVGNELTSDEVIRRELLQFERERYSAEKIRRSISRVRRLGYFNRVQIDVTPVVDNPDEIDLLVNVEETNTGEIRFGAGFSSDGGTSFNAGLSNSNIFGTGNDFSADFSTGESSTNFKLNLDEHYYTDEGITRHIAASYGETEASNDSSSYSIDGYKGEYGFDIPFTDDGEYHVYLAYQQVKVNNVSSLNTVYQSFTDKHGDSFDTLLINTGLFYDTRDAASVPTEGHRIDFTGELAPPAFDLKYYYLNYLHDYYYLLRSLPTDPVLHFRLGGGYGDSYGGGVYPFYRRFHLGGTSDLRGFDSDSIGYAVDSSNRSLGGRSRLYGTIELSADAEFFAFEEQQLFLVPFIDVGAVGEKFGLGSARASWGVELRWVSPVGPLRFSYVETLRSKKEDDVESFQFSVSTF